MNSRVKILYTNITSCTINNDYGSNWFDLRRGVSQGCPLSGLLFVFAVEILFIAVRASSDIKGILIANRARNQTYVIRGRYYSLFQGYILA